MNRESNSKPIAVPIKPETSSQVFERMRKRGEAVASNTKAHAGTKPDYPEDVYDAIFGLKAPPHESFIASAIEPRVRGAVSTSQALIKRTKQDYGERVYIVSITPQSWRGLPDRLRLNVREPRKIKSILKKCGVENAIGVTALLNRPIEADFGFESYLSLRMILFGSALDSEKMDSLERNLTARFPSFGPYSAVRQSEVETSPLGISLASERLF